MNAFFVFVTRWMLAMFWVFGALQQSESVIVCQEKPDDPTVVVLGVNSSEVFLIWESCKGNNLETIRSYSFFRQRPGSVEQEQIASRDFNQGFTMIKPFKDEKKYKASLEQVLKIINVKRDEEYVYTLEVDFRDVDGALQEEHFRATIDVKVPPQITVSPKREDEVTLSSSSVQNRTLRCNASGDPHPYITWTKAGVPASRFNASGYELHLVDIKREDAGSYICTASNGFGNSTSAIGIINIRCTNCKTEKVGIRIREMTFKNSLSITTSKEFKDVESPLSSAIWGAYADNPGKQLYEVDVKELRNGSVFAIVELVFGSSVSDPLKPLRDEMNDGKLGSFTVDKQLDDNPTTPPITESTESTTVDKRETPTGGARTSSLTEAELWGIIGGCIAFVVVVAIIILVCCICRKKSKNSGASKSGKSYSEADGYRMNRQPPPSGLGTASPAYVEARQYAPVTAARRQDDQSKPPLNYSELSFNNSSGPGRQPPPYSGTEYSEMSPEKRPPPTGGQQGEGGGFELWC